MPKRLTERIGRESYPKVSPNGNTIASTANHDGNSGSYHIRKKFQPPRLRHNQVASSKPVEITQLGASRCLLNKPS